MSDIIISSDMPNNIISQEINDNEVNNENSNHTLDSSFNTSLQDSFQRFREKKIIEKQLIKLCQESQKVERTSTYKDILRSKFIHGAKKYLGVPYSEKYRDIDAPVAPIYLDCCGLIRQVLLDLQVEFGFAVGRWNQCYQIDTLPIVIDDPKELQPGDLVFYEGTYYAPRAKLQKHNMVHVEIYLGGDAGEETIGARNQRGGVDIFPSYQFASKNWELTRYHFRSIDTWLDGVCKSCCPDHPWTTDDIAIRGTSGKKSIFYVDSDDESAGDDDVMEVVDHEDEMKHHISSPIIEDKDDSITSSKKLPRKPKSSSSSSSSSSPTASNFFKATSSSSAKIKHIAPKTFYVGKSNGYKLVIDAMVRRGWNQIPFEYTFSNRYGLKWVERRSQIDYKAHSAGQMVNHIPNNDCITNKVNLYATMHDFFASSHHHNGNHDDGHAMMLPWLPATYRLDNPAECLAAVAYEIAYKQQHDVDGIWIYKPSCNNRGRGIKVISGRADLEEICYSNTSSSTFTSSSISPSSAASTPVSRSQSLSAIAQQPTPWRGLVQKYIENPMLIGPDRLKFDIRCYLLVATTYPKTLAFYHRGYCRLSLKSYTIDKASLDDQTIHLTNAAIQKQDRLYHDNKEKQIQLPAKIADILAHDGQHDHASYIRRKLDDDIKRCMVDVMKACNPILSKKHGYFDLLGCDFMITGENELKLLEINTNPALSLDNSTLEALLPGVVDASLDIVLGCQGPDCKYNSSGSNITANKYATVNPSGFELIYDEASGYAFHTNS